MADHGVEANSETIYVHLVFEFAAPHCVRAHVGWSAIIRRVFLDSFEVDQAKICEFDGFTLDHDVL